MFSSSVAVFGGPLPPVVPENMALLPQSSYGTEKAIAELLVSDYSRRGFVDGISCRLPTVAIRPGKPNSALSSFVSGIVREPLAGLESVCPVPLDTRLWITLAGCRHGEPGPCRCAEDGCAWGQPVGQSSGAFRDDGRHAR